MCALCVGMEVTNTPWLLRFSRRGAGQVLRYFSGHLLSEPAAARGFETFGSAQGEGGRLEPRKTEPRKTCQV